MWVLWEICPLGASKKHTPSSPRIDQLTGRACQLTIRASTVNSSIAFHPAQVAKLAGHACSALLRRHGCGADILQTHKQGLSYLQRACQMESSSSWELGKKVADALEPSYPRPMIGLEMFVVMEYPSARLIAYPARMHSLPTGKFTVL